MSTIWKFPLNLYGPDGNVTDRPVVDIPEGALILTLCLQRGQPTMWAVVDPDAPMAQRRFVVVGTGQPMPDEPTVYVGTWLSDEDGTFVFHVFDQGEEDRDG